MRCLEFLAFVIGYEVYTFFGRVRLPFPSFGLAFIWRSSSEYKIITLFGIYRIPLFALKDASHRLVHHIGGNLRKIPYEEGVPFTVAEGEIWLQKGKRRGLGVAYTTLKKGKEYPFPLE